MKIYSMKGLLVNDDNPYRNMVSQEPRVYAKLRLTDLYEGFVLKMKWAVDAADKPIGHFIMIPGSKLTSDIKTIQFFKKFAPNNTILKILIDGDDFTYAALQPVFHAIDDNKLEHIFMMFSHYKSLLVTQLVKDEWERLGLTGAVFKEVAEMDDERFIAVE